MFKFVPDDNAESSRRKAKWGHKLAYTDKRKLLTYIASLCIVRFMIPKELIAASTEPLILSLLSKGESYGYALIQDVKQLSSDRIQWTDGMLYPVLHRMEDEGLIESRWGLSENGRKRKYYSIKKDGRRVLDKQREEWQTVSQLLKQLGKENYA